MPLLAQNARMNDTPAPQPAVSDSALEAARREKLRKIRELGVDPWGARFDDHQPIGEIRAREGEIRVVPAERFRGRSARTAWPQGPRGRADRAPPPHGQAASCCKSAIGPAPIQVMIGKNQVGEENLSLAECFDLGDIVGVDGELKRTKTGELTIFAEDLHFLTKSIETPPDKHKGLTDPELRQRMRYLDLIHTDGVLERFLRRTKIVAVDPQHAGRRGVRRGRGADAARDRRRGGRPAVHHAPQRPGHRPLPADRPGAAPEAAAGRRHRAGVRAGPRLSQRGHQTPAQPRVHHARGLPGLRRLPRR